MWFFYCQYFKALPKFCPWQIFFERGENQLLLGKSFEFSSFNILAGATRISWSCAWIIWSCMKASHYFSSSLILSRPSKSVPFVSSITCQFWHTKTKQAASLWAGSIRFFPNVSHYLVIFCEASMNG